MLRKTKPKKLPETGIESMNKPTPKPELDLDLLKEVEAHQTDSENYMGTLRDKWPDYESMLIAENRESMGTDSHIFDPRLSTIEIERTARVAAQRPSGKAFAVSKDDIGKNMIMELLLNYQIANANEQWDFLVKQMMLSFWSRVYGQIYTLVPWRVNPTYVGPEMFLISPWDSFPQPNVTMQDAEWFIQGHMLSINWLKKQNKETWNMDEINALSAEMKEGDGQEGDVRRHDNHNSYISSQMFPTQFGDKKYPKVKAFTEYRKGKWITWAPRINPKKGRAYLLRVVEDPYPEDFLPIVAKYAIPMFEGPTGIGPFQRGKSLQFGTNSLINLYFSGIRTSLFPEKMVNPDNVVMSSLKYGAAEQWFMQNPGQDVQVVQRGSESTSTFNNAYGMLISAMLNQAGTTDTSNSAQVESSLGKTPQALRLQAASQGAQDFWEQTMLESTLRQVFERWVALNTTELEADAAVRIFGSEIEKIKELYPEETEAFSDTSGKILISKKLFQTKKGDPIKFDYQIETGSTTKPNMDQEKTDVEDTLRLFAENPQIIEMMKMEGSGISMTELVKRVLTKKGQKDLDKIVIKSMEQPEQQPQEGMPMDPNAVPPEQMPPEMPPPPQYQDPDVSALAEQLFGGMGGVPQQWRM